MLQFFDTLTDDSGNSLLGATVTVTNYPSGTLASIYSTNGTTSPIANSAVAADITGQVSFYAPDGAYTLTYAYKGTNYKVRSPVQLLDPMGFVAATDTGVANAYVVAGAQYPAQKYIGLKLEFLAQHANTTAATLTYQGDAGFAINQPGGVALGAGMIATLGLTRVEWDGTQWQLIGAQNQPFYALTPAEIAAGLTYANITNTSYVGGDLRRYGATLNGNITAAMQSAIAQAQQAGASKIVFPEELGTGCTVTAGFTSAVPIVIEGAGYSECVITATGDFTILTLPLAASGSRISGIRFNGIGVGATQAGVVLTNCNQCVFTNVRVTNFGRGFQLVQGANACYLNTWINCRSESNNLFNFDLGRLSNGSKLIDVTFGGTPAGAAITGITKAASAVITINTVSTVNPFSVNQPVRITGVGGMTQLNGLTPTVTAIGGVSGAWTVTVNFNSTNATTYTAGGTLVSASWGLRIVDSNFLSILGGDCEGTALGCIDIDNVGGGTFGNCGHVIQGVDVENTSALYGEVRIGQTNVVNGVTITGGYSNPTYGDASNPTVGSRCNVNIGPGGCNGLTVIGQEVSAGSFGQTEFITAITQAASAVVTVATTQAANPWQVGQTMSFANVAGMTQINGLSGTITAIGGVAGAWTATVNINSSAFSAYTSGGTATVIPGYIQINGPLTNERILLAGPFSGQQSQYLSEEGKVNYVDRPGLSLQDVVTSGIDVNHQDAVKQLFYRTNSGSILANKNYAAGLSVLRMEATTAPGAGSALWAHRSLASDGYGWNVRGHQVQGALDLTDLVVPYTSGSGMAWRANTGNYFKLTITDGVAWTINAPLNPQQGQVMTLTVRNTSGGALGAATFNAVFKMAAWVSPATGNSRSVTWKYDGANWVEVSRTPSDVPN
jgi:hypothetical protein